MKHRALLRRALPLAVLAAFLFALQLPASAFFFGRPEESTVAPISKNGPLGEPISGDQADGLHHPVQHVPVEKRGDKRKQMLPFESAQHSGENEDEERLKTVLRHAEGEPAQIA